VSVPTAHGNLNVLVGGEDNNHYDFDLLLVHGLIVSSNFMLPTAKCLAGTYRVVLPDLLGHGLSETPDHPLGVREHAQTLALASKKLNLRKPIIVGGSYGCHVAVELSSLIDVKALVFVGPTPGDDLSKAFLELLRDAFYEPLPLVLSVIAEVFRIGPGRVIDLLNNMASYPFHRRLRQVAAPTLVITGEHDPFLNEEFMEKACQILRRSHSLCVPRVAHGLPFSQPELISGFIEEFIDRLQDSRVVAA
jgi:pimeloyl-ACP methyl ester carboxylesterase